MADQRVKITFGPWLHETSPQERRDEIQMPGPPEEGPYPGAPRGEWRPITTGFFAEPAAGMRAWVSWFWFTEDVDLRPC